MKKVVVAMSGGVDSSVAAALLKEQGHEVIGVTLRLSDWQETEGRSFGGCCGSKDFYDARSVAQALDIPHYALDYVDPFRRSVITYFTRSYQAGETPNPCIACNQFVKFDRLLEQASALGADCLATGHYARIDVQDASEYRRAGVSATEHERRVADTPTPRYVLRKALDSSKDQSYVLYHLKQDQLSRLIFPLGGYAKTEIRMMARRYGLVTAEKPDSQEICFVPNGDHNAFLKETLEEEDRRPGPIRHRDGRILGQHQGLPFYTIGQRGGLGVAVGRPLYVVALEPGSNTLVVGEKTDVYSKSAAVREVSWVTGESPEIPLKVMVKIRYKHVPAMATIYPSQPENAERGTRNSEGGSLHEDNLLPHSAFRTPHALITQDVIVSFEEPQPSVTPGQAAVFYDGDCVLGGGVIDHVIQ